MPLTAEVFAENFKRRENVISFSRRFFEINQTKAKNFPGGGTLLQRPRDVQTR